MTAFGKHVSFGAASQIPPAVLQLCSLPLCRIRQYKKIFSTAIFRGYTFCGCSCAKPFRGPLGREHLHQTFLSEKHELEQFDAGVKKIFTDGGKLEYFDMLNKRSNIANHVLKKQIHELGKLKKQGLIDDFEHSDLVKQITELFNHQGGCERIKNTPLYRQYSIFSRVFVVLFIALVPFGLLNEMDKAGEFGVWLTVPFSMLISWVFYTMEQIGEFSENPFDNALNDVPISAICTAIETDVKEFLGDDNLPKKAMPVDDVLL